MALLQLIYYEQENIYLKKKKWKVIKHKYLSDMFWGLFPAAVRPMIS